MPKKYGDPFEFGLVDSGHFVVFRKVWRQRRA
jgi:hypothetical protein